MQFEQFEDERVDLPRPSIDTGMGLERIGGAVAGQARQLRHRPDAQADLGLGRG
jgi:alanyl-tRNA synthetase